MFHAPIPSYFTDNSTNLGLFSRNKLLRFFILVILHINVANSGIKGVGIQERTKKYDKNASQSKLVAFSLFLSV